MNPMTTTYKVVYVGGYQILNATTADAAHNEALQVLAGRGGDLWWRGSDGEWHYAWEVAR